MNVYAGPGVALGTAYVQMSKTTHFLPCVCHHPAHTCIHVTHGDLGGVASKEVARGRILKVEEDSARWDRKGGPGR